MEVAGIDKIKGTDGSSAELQPNVTLEAAERLYKLKTAETLTTLEVTERLAKLESAERLSLLEATEKLIS